MAAEAAQDEFYHRPVDRSVEKGEFFQLPHQDRTLICQLRGATEGFRVKMTEMRDTLDDKERDLGREAALRKAAEERLDQLVDMYGDPAVNAELKERLPRARNREARSELQKRLDDISRRGDSILTSSSPDLHLADLDTPDASGATRRSRSKSADSLDGTRPRRRSSAYDVNADGEVTTRRRQRSHSPPGTHSNSHSRQYSGPYPPHPAHSYPGYPSPPYPLYHPPPYYSYPPQPPPPPMMYHSPMQVPYMQAAPPMNHQGLVMTPGVNGVNIPAPVAQSTPVQGGHVTTAQMNATPTNTSAANMTSGYMTYYPMSTLAASSLSGAGDSPMATVAAPVQSGVSMAGIPAHSAGNFMNQSGAQVYSGGHANASPAVVTSAGNIMNQPNMQVPSSGIINQGSQVTGQSIPIMNLTPEKGLGGVTMVTPIQSVRLARLANGSVPNGLVGLPSEKDLSVSREQNRQISLLLKELDAARELNKKLQTQLAEMERELDSLKAQMKTQQASHQAEISARAAALVEEIYRAQKQRDEAMMGRLKSANEERDEVLLKLKRSDRGLDQLDDSGLDKDASLRQLMSSLDTSGASTQVSHYGSVFAEAIRNMTDRKKKMTVEEMRAVLEERDAIMVKCRHLESEVLKLQRQNRARVPEQQQQATLQAKLLATQQERDTALSRIRKQEEELQTLRVYYSLHKSLSQEEHLRDQFNNELAGIEGQLKKRDSTITIAQKENNHLLAQIKSLLAEKNQISDQLSTAQSTIKQEQEKSDKLERLVNVLRRKLTGAGNKTDD